ncbi:PREDICTED: circadian-associated transcriptional repressor-like [Cyprinodon variegatus]|uniref:Circadian associated repressor of transcription a n=1 Tax=Cyprinodon variegatus TaxID=28743 RepID=A0A3Q2D951_CYPVA|nr:PREDICTED: circadian-associated transcriptional repressor-like [Cyprinodon variegatus]
MNTLSKSSKWPSYDSLPSTSSFPPSENEQTEDEADVFSEGEGDSDLKSPLHAKIHDHQSELYSDEAKHLSLEAAALRPSSATPGDLTFAKKCADLHRYTHPLLELLKGLKTGRFEKGLTSFQQSVAIDRLQRILGVLQKPEMGEKYLQNLLQIEMLLKMWLPQESFKPVDKPKQTSTPTLTSHWRKNQLHIPVKKRKLSWSDPDVTASVPAKQSCRQHEEHESCLTSTCLPLSPENLTTLEDKTAEMDNCSEGQRFPKRTNPISGSHSCIREEHENQKPTEDFLPSPCGSPATQVYSVSSSNSVTAIDSP